MSGGGGSNSTQQTQMPQWLTDAGQFAATQGQQYINQPYNGMQNSAANTANNYGNMAPGALGSAYNTFQSTSNYQPDQGGYGPLLSLLGQSGGSYGNSAMGSGLQGGLTGNGGGPGGNAVNLNMGDAAQAQAGQIDPAALQQMQAGQLSNTSLDPYYNPFQQSVIDTTMTGLNQNLQQQLNGNAGNATAAGAFGGTRQAVQNALTNQAGQQTAASTLASLNSQNFTQAQAAALQDIQNQMGASQFNAGQYNQALGANASNQQATNLANANAQNQFGLANAANATSRYGSDRSAEAQLGASANAAGASMYGANRSADASNLNARLSAALGLAGLQQTGSLDAAQLRQAGGNAMQGFGQAGLAGQGSWGNQIYNQPMQNLGWYTGMVGGLNGGSTVTQHTDGGSNPWATAGGYAALLASMYGGGG